MGMKSDDWMEIGSFILKAATRLLQNTELIDSLLASDELDDVTKKKIESLRKAAKEEWDSLAPQ